MEACDEIIRYYKNFSIKLIVPICSKIFHREKLLKKIFSNKSKAKKVIVLCTGYPNIFRGLFAKIFNVKNWKFLGYKNGFSLTKNASVYKLNEVDKESLIRYIKNSLRSKQT